MGLSVFSLLFLLYSSFMEENLVFLYKLVVILMKKVFIVYGAYTNTYKVPTHFRWRVWHLLSAKNALPPCHWKCRCALFLLVWHIDSDGVVCCQWGFFLSSFLSSPLKFTVWFSLLLVFQLQSLFFLFLIFILHLLVKVLFILISSFNLNFFYILFFFQFSPYSFDFYFFSWPFCKVFICF